MKGFSACCWNKHLLWTNAWRPRGCSDFPGVVSWVKIP